MYFQSVCFFEPYKHKTVTTETDDVAVMTVFFKLVFLSFFILCVFCVSSIFGLHHFKLLAVLL